MQKIKLDKQAIFFFSLAAVLLLKVTVFIPLNGARLRAANRKINDLRQQIKFIEKEWPQKESYLTKRRQLEEKIAQHQEKFIASGQEARLMSFISQNSRRYGVKINSIVPGAPFAASVRGFENIPFQIEAEGSFFGLVDFLKFIQNNGYFLRVQELRISGYNPGRISMVLCGLKKK